MKDLLGGIFEELGVTHYIGASPENLAEIRRDLVETKAAKLNIKLAPLRAHAILLFSGSGEVSEDTQNHFAMGAMRWIEQERERCARVAENAEWGDHFAAEKIAEKIRKGE
jgi:hypothetical protein